MLKILNIPLLILVVPYILICLPMFWNHIPFEVTFESMAPTYKKDEVVYYMRVKSTDIKVGDLIIYDDNEYEHSRIFHRVIELDREGYKTKGDGNLQNDNYVVKYEDVVGKVQDQHFPYIGFYVKFIKDNSIILYASLASWIFFLILNIIVLVNDKKADKKTLLEKEAPKEEIKPVNTQETKQVATEETKPIEEKKTE